MDSEPAPVSSEISSVAPQNLPVVYHEGLEEIDEGGLVVDGETLEKDDSDSGDETVPVRRLGEFSIYDSANRNRLVLFDELTTGNL